MFKHNPAMMHSSYSDPIVIQDHDLPYLIDAKNYRDYVDTDTDQDANKLASVASVYFDSEQTEFDFTDPLTRKVQQRGNLNRLVEFTTLITSARLHKLSYDEAVDAGYAYRGGFASRVSSGGASMCFLETYSDATLPDYNIHNQFGAAFYSISKSISNLARIAADSKKDKPKPSTKTILVQTDHGGVIEFARLFTLPFNSALYKLFVLVRNCPHKTFWELLKFDLVSHQDRLSDIECFNILPHETMYRMINLLAMNIDSMPKAKVSLPRSKELSGQAYRQKRVLQSPVVSQRQQTIGQTYLIRAYNEFVLSIHYMGENRARLYPYARDIDTPDHKTDYNYDSARELLNGYYQVMLQRYSKQISQLIKSCVTGKFYLAYRVIEQNIVNLQPRTVRGTSFNTLTNDLNKVLVKRLP